MTEEEELKNILNSKLSSEEVPFDEENWEEAEKMIDTARKKEKRRRWAIIFFIGLVAGIAVMVPFALKTNNNDTRTNTTPVNEPKDKPAASNGNSPSKAPPIISQPGNISQPNSSGATITVNKTEPAGNTHTDKSLAENTNKIESTKKTSCISNQHTVVSKNRVSASVSFNKTHAKQKNTTTIATKYSRNKSAKDKTNPPASSNNSGSNNNMQSNSTASVRTKAVKNEEPVKNNPADITNTPVSVTQQTSPVINNPPKKEPVKQNTITIASDSAQKSVTAANTTKKDSAVKKIDTTKPVAQANPALPPPSAKKPLRKDIISVEAGTSYSLGWSYGNTTEANGFNPVAGFGFTHLFDSTWAIHIGAYYTTINNLSSSTYTSQHTNYDFGYSATDTTITTKWLHYITLPVQLQYNINNKNYIGAGGSISYLITSTGTMTTYNQTAFTAANKAVITQTGYSKGFNTFNASVMALYGRRFSDKLSASIIAYFGLMDIKDNAFFSTQQFERESGLRILLAYDIF
ncbi:MAG TPA: porin family protein [Bacteroidia bacterium]|jgi:hypothetical protein|nr:porin family protein [Bacteroidia bacterium]